MCEGCFTSEFSENMFPKYMVSFKGKYKIKRGISIFSFQMEEKETQYSTDSSSLNCLCSKRNQYYFLLVLLNIGLAKKAIQFFYMLLWKNSDELFSQHKRYP